MLDNDLKNQLKQYLTYLTQPIELVAALDGGKAASEMKALLEEISSLSDKISVSTETDADVRIPS